MWGDNKDGCNRIETGPGKVPLDQWVHVGFTMLTRGNKLTAALYMNGALVASKDASARTINAKSKWRIGMHNNDDHRFSGRIGPVLVSDAANEDLLKWSASQGPPKITYSVSATTKVPDHVQGMYIYKNIHPKSSEAPDASGRAHHAIVHVLRDAAAKETAAGVNSNIQVLDVVREENLPDLLLAVDKADLVAGKVPVITDPDILAQSDARGAKNADFVRQVMKRAYGAYEKFAFGMDEVAPNTGKGNNRWSGMAVTMLDSLDTLHLMGLMDEFNRATEWVDKTFNLTSIGTYRLRRAFASSEVYSARTIAAATQCISEKRKISAIAS